MSPLLSVVVPTHNRSAYAISCIEAVLGIESQDLQLVVSDTSTDDLLYNLLESPTCQFLDDKRFVYRRIQAPSNLTKNHNDAMEFADGEYVCIIGDDDCITRAAIDATRWASVHRIPLVSHTQMSIYAWPDFRSKLSRKGHAARLYVPRQSGSARWRNSADDLAVALARAFQGTEAMPRCYHGIVRRDLLEQVRERTGAYFHGSSPDMSGAVALSCLIEQYCEVDLPLTISGISSGSNSGRSAMNTHKGELSAESQTNSYESAGWTLGVPRFFSVETVWAHAGLETLRKFEPEAIKNFNYLKLLALCTLRHPDFAEKSARAVDEVESMRGVPIRTKLVAERRRERRARWANLLRRLMNPTAANGRRFFDKISTVAEASRRYEEYAQTAGLQFRPPT